MQVSASAGAALVWTEAGKEGLRIACRRNPADLMVAAPQLAGGSGAVELRIGEQAFALAAEGEAPHLSAAGPLTEALPAALVPGQAIVVRHAGRATNPLPAPEAKVAAAFAAACRTALGPQAR